MSSEVSDEGAIPRASKDGQTYSNGGRENGWDALGRQFRLKTGRGS